MMRKKLSTMTRYLTFVVLVAAVSAAARAEQPEAPREAVDAEADIAAAKATIDAMRTTGKALFAWLQAHPVAAAPAAAQPGVPAVDWAQCPAISYDEARQLLVPEHVAEVPRDDGWGRPLELCLRRSAHEPPGALSIGVRSAGRDGTFEGSTYTPGAFDALDFDRDVVWLDGYFVTWPQRAE